MKKFFKIMLPLVLMGTLAIFPIQNSNASQPEADEEAEAIAPLLRSYGYDVHPYYSRGMLNRGQSTTLSRTFYAGNEYALVVGGCSYTRDIDIYVYDKYWNLIASDKGAAKHGVVNFDVYQTGTFHIKIKMYDATSDGVHWAMLYAYK
jgi:hypothetical protein